MQKSYEVKIYNLDGGFKETLLWTSLITSFNYSSQINGWQWEATFELDKKFETTTYSIGDFVRVYVYTDSYPGGNLLYSGTVSRITRRITSGIETLKLTCIGLASILGFIYFYQGSYVFNKNQDPAQTIKDVIDYFNTKYSGSWLSYSGWNISNYGSSVNLDFNYSKCLDSINSARNLTNFWWRLDPDGQVFFKTVPGTVTHTFTLENDVDEINLEETGERIVNKHITTYKTGVATPSIDAASQTTYGLRELMESKTDIGDSGSAVIYSNNYISKNKDFEKKTSITVNNNYNIENIKPWDTIKILNVNYGITGLQIQKIVYTTNSVKLELGSLTSLSEEIFNP